MEKNAPHAPARIHDVQTAKAFAERYAAARAHLRREMNAVGLTEAQGWFITEYAREASGGSQVVLRPLHLHLKPPPGLECIVWVDEAGTTVEAECTPGGRPPYLG